MVGENNSKKSYGKILTRLFEWGYLKSTDCRDTLWCRALEDIGVLVFSIKIGGLSDGDSGIIYFCSDEELNNFLLLTNLKDFVMSLESSEGCKLKTRLVDSIYILIDGVKQSFFAFKCDNIFFGFEGEIDSFDIQNCYQLIADQPATFRI